MSDLSPSDDELGSAVNVTYTPRVIKFIDRGEQDALQSMLCKRRMKFDVARTPMLDCLYDADGSTLLHELIKAENSLPIHPWEPPRRNAPPRSRRRPRWEAVSSALQVLESSALAPCRRFVCEHRHRRTRRSAEAPLGEGSRRHPHPQHDRKLLEARCSNAGLQGCGTGSQAV